jgi:hypothetical protein
MNVKTFMIIVLNVMTSELTYPIVIAQNITMKIPTCHAKNVTILVMNVQEQPQHVPFVMLLPIDIK